jgi:DNA polymerase III sliding clamp (beta) subunit (PCNA family)
MKVINKFLIIEIKETNYFNQFDVDYSINLQTSKGFDTLVEAQKKLQALNELKQDNKLQKTQYKIQQIAINSGSSAPRPSFLYKTLWIGKYKRLIGKP